MHESLPGAAVGTVLSFGLWWAALWILRWTTPLTGVFLLLSSLLAVALLSALGLAVVSAWERRHRQRAPVSRS